jgi:Spy/CpxP family protein refolding chaperone
MHPGFAYWWRERGRHRGACGEESCGAEAFAGGPGEGHEHDHHHDHGGRHRHGGRRDHHGPPFGPWAQFGGDGDFGGGPFGVRRPLRFLAHKLDLRDEQVAELARVLDDLKTERAQGEVDQRRSTAAFADAVAGEAFDETKVNEAADARVKSAERLRGAIVKALGRIHTLLDPEQRGKLAYLLRTGALSI